MQATVGDRISILRHDEHGVFRDGVIIEVPGGAGQPPYYVRWSDDGHVSLFFPGPDARVTHYEEGTSPTSR